MILGVIIGTLEQSSYKHYYERECFHSAISYICYILYCLDHAQCQNLVVYTEFTHKNQTLAYHRQGFNPPPLVVPLHLLCVHRFRDANTSYFGHVSPGRFHIAPTRSRFADSLFTEFSFVSSHKPIMYNDQL